MLHITLCAAMRKSAPGRVRLAFAATLLTVAAYAQQPPAAAPSLTLAEAQRLALLRSHQLPGIDAAVAAARDMATAAGQRPDPVLKLGIDNLPVNGSERYSLTKDFMTMRRVGVMQELTHADKRHWRAETQSRMADKAREERNAAGIAIERDTALAWIDSYFAEAASRLVAEQEDQASLEIQAAETSYRAGRGSQADVLTARSALAMMGDRAGEAARRARNARIALSRWVGDSGARPLDAPPAFDAIPFDPTRLEGQLAQLPQIAVLSRQEDIASAAVNLAQADKKADWSVEVALQQRGPAYANMISVGLSVPLQWDRKNRQDREVAARLATAEQARAERMEAERALLADIRAMIEEWTNGRERLARYERELLPLAADRAQAVLGAYRGGKASLSDVLVARRNETETRLQALQLQMETARAWANLNYLFPADSSRTPANHAVKVSQ